MSCTASYSRYSSDQQNAASIVDQQRCCKEAAAREGLVIPPELEFSDAAVSGTKLDRDGLNAMLLAAKEGRFKTLFFYNLSRLARESVISMPMLKQLVYIQNVRIVGVTEGIDSGRDGWEMIATIFSMMAERYIKELSQSVFRGQEGTVLAGLAVGDHCFGYDSIPVAGSEQFRKGRHAKPRMQYVIDEQAASWVVRVFHWFVKERRSIRWITVQLNQLGAPKDHRSTTKDWHHQYVAKLLCNQKYIGIWPWGQRKNIRNPLDGVVHQEERPDEETDKWTRQFPHLRIIDDETWNSAEKILEENKKQMENRRKPNGTWRGSKTGNAANHPGHLLAQLVRCECGAFLTLAGSNGKYLGCPRYRVGKCQFKTQLCRDLAEKLILDAISNCIMFDAKWKDAILQETRDAWRKQAHQQPAEIRRLETALADGERKIQRLMDSIESGNDSPDVRQRLQDRRRENESHRKELCKAQEVPEAPTEEPTKEWVEQQLMDLFTVLKGQDPSAAWALRNLVGGKILVREIREPGRKRFFFQGKINLSIRQAIHAMARKCNVPEAPIQNQDAVAEGPSLEIKIDFRGRSVLIADSERARELCDQGLKNAQIAARMGCAPNRVTKLLKHWHHSRGLAMQNGHQRASTLSKKEPGIPLSETLAEEAKLLWDDGLADEQIAAQLGCSPLMAVEALDQAFRSRGHAPPTYAERRLALLGRLVNLYDQKLPLNEIASKVGLNSLSVRRLLRERLHQLGREIVDGRSRNAKK